MDDADVITLLIIALVAFAVQYAVIRLAVTDAILAADRKRKRLD